MEIMGIISLASANGYAGTALGLSCMKAGEDRFCRAMWKIREAGRRKKAEY